MSLVGTEFAFLNSPFSVKPGEFVELRTLLYVSFILTLLQGKINLPLHVSPY
jgi:hypothetical protein